MVRLRRSRRPTRRPRTWSPAQPDMLAGYSPVLAKRRPTPREPSSASLLAGPLPRPQACPAPSLVFALIGADFLAVLVPVALQARLMSLAVRRDPPADVRAPTALAP